MLSQFGISSIYHCTPLHYAPLILRSRRLYSRHALERQGFMRKHFRRTSSEADRRRGFDNFVFCNTHSQFPLLDSKLERGFPHYLIEIPVTQLDGRQYLLCRLNIARSRTFRVDTACEDYHDNLRLPVARTDEQKVAMLKTWWRRKDCAREVLVEQQIDLTSDVRLIVFSEEDSAELTMIARQVGFEARIVHGRLYRRCPLYAAAIKEITKKLLIHPEWRGYCLDYDNLSKRCPR